LIVREPVRYVDVEFEIDGAEKASDPVHGRAPLS
jgi:hypothetical protein